MEIALFFNSLEVVFRYHQKRDAGGLRGAWLLVSRIGDRGK